MSTSPNYRKEDHPRWHGGYCIKDGKVWVRCEGDHPRKGTDGYVSRATLVAESKIGRLLEPGEVVHHVNRNKLDDSPDNLMVVTQAEHMRLHANDWDINKNKARGERQWFAKLTADQVREIRRRYGTMTNVELGRMFGVTKGNVRSIVLRQTWAHVA
jgi:DNA-directed RNA polymerase sigma subunit (sigma70/sigma32)